MNDAVPVQMDEQSGPPVPQAQQESSSDEDEQPPQTAAIIPENMVFSGVRQASEHDEASSSQSAEMPGLDLPAIDDE